MKEWPIETKPIEQQDIAIKSVKPVIEDIESIKGIDVKNIKVSVKPEKSEDLAPDQPPKKKKSKKKK
jgi:hypothetical protein